MCSNSRLRFGGFCCGAIVLAIGCSANSNNSGKFRPPVTGGAAASTSSGTGFAGRGVIGGLGAAAGANASNGFGNSNVMPMVIGDPNAVTKCKDPIVMFVVDGSGSMCSTYGTSGSRWQAIRAALVDPKMGLIYQLQNRGSFGLFIFDGAIDTSVPDMTAGPMLMCLSPNTFSRINSMTCLGMVQVAPAKNNAQAIDGKFPRTELGGSTPTDKAMNQVVDTLIAAQVPPWDPVANPQFIILSTDGAPNDICPGGKGGDGSAQQTAVLQAVDRAWTAGITTFAISLAGGDMTLESRVQEIAMHGNPMDPMAHSFSPMNQADLVTTLKQLLGNAFGCAVE